VWDLDENRYIDMCIAGIGACPLGYADPDVDGAVKEAIRKGSMCTLNCPEEVELAETLLHLHPWAGMVRYARGGGEAMAIAVRIARAYTGRDRIAFCGYHGWHDWYLAANLADDHNLDGQLLPGLAPRGVPRSLKGTALPFRYNNLGDLEEIARRYGGEIAAVVMEPVRDREPEKGFLEGAARIAEELGALFVIDEVSAGFRLNTGGAHLRYKLQPDIAVFAKAMSNGYPMAAVIGREDPMQAAQETFISSTYWTERIGPTAAIATIEKYLRRDVPGHLVRAGRQVQEGWQKAADSAGLPIEIAGIAPLAHFSFRIAEKDEAQTLFSQLMLERGFLAGKSFYATLAHTDEHIRDYITACEEVLGLIADGVSRGTVLQMLKGPVAHAGFRRLT